METLKCLLRSEELLVIDGRRFAQRGFTTRGYFRIVQECDYQGFIQQAVMRNTELGIIPPGLSGSQMAPLGSGIESRGHFSSGPEMGTFLDPRVGIQVLFFLGPLLPHPGPVKRDVATPSGAHRGPCPLPLRARLNELPPPSCRFPGDRPVGIETFAGVTPRDFGCRIVVRVVFLAAKQELSRSQVQPSRSQAEAQPASQMEKGLGWGSKGKMGLGWGSRGLRKRCHTGPK